MQRSGINEVWHRAPEIPELNVASPLLHHGLIKTLEAQMWILYEDAVGSLG